MKSFSITEGERVWDDFHQQWCKFVGAPRLGNFTTDKNGKFVYKVLNPHTKFIVVRYGKFYQINAKQCYRIAKGKMTLFGDVVCYEHNKTIHNYPYYCPSRLENMFGIECNTHKN